MNNNYSNQSPYVAFSGQALTSDYTDTQFEFSSAGFLKLSLDIGYTMGAAETANKVLFKLEHSADGGATWYSLVIDETGATSVITPRVWEYTGTGNVNVIVDIAYKMMRLSMIETGVAANAGSVSVTALLSGY